MQPITGKTLNSASMTEHSAPIFLDQREHEAEMAVVLHTDAL